jgi:2-polyprenyl-3-methyl-5-hydroxy-6-metoxy-1,4-benzoquinol methylase
MAYKYKGVDKFSSHYKIAFYISKLKKKTSLLDLGCNAGFIGRALRNVGWRGHLTGIDKQKDYKSIILKSGYNKFLNIDIEKDISKIRKKYDLVIFADVLEHLINPQEVLIKIKKNLKKNGVIIISLPNIANLYIRLTLLMGKFDYSDRGILDRDHKLFYTKKTAEMLLKKSNLKIISYDYTPIPLPILYPIFSSGRALFFLYYLLNYFSLIKPSFFAYQFIFVCQ